MIIKIDKFNILLCKIFKGNLMTKDKKKTKKKEKEKGEKRRKHLSKRDIFSVVLFPSTTLIYN